MILQNANTEPFVRLHRFHEEFNRHMRVTVAALESLPKPAADGSDPSGLSVLSSGGEPWGTELKWKTVKVSIASSQAKRFISHMGILGVMSAFEDYLGNVKATFDRHADFIGMKSGGTSQEEKAKEEALTNLLSQLHWDRSPISFLLPLHGYFVLVRNCIAHRAGRASKALVEKSQSKELLNSLEKWPSRAGTKIASLPIVSPNVEIPLLPRHAVLAAEVTYRAAKHLNMKLVEFLGEEGLVFMTAYNILLGDDLISIPKCGSAEKAINRTLVGRYRVAIQTRHESTQLLKRLGKWKPCLAKYEKVFG